MCVCGVCDMRVCVCEFGCVCDMSVQVCAQMRVNECLHVSLDVFVSE